MNGQNDRRYHETVGALHGKTLPGMPASTTHVVWTPRDLNLSKECARRRKQAERAAVKT